MLGGSAALAIAATLAACSSSDSGSGSDDAKGSIYFLNFKPEADEAFKSITSTYKEEDRRRGQGGDRRGRNL